MIHDSHQALDVLFVPRQEGPEAKFLLLTPTVFPSQFGCDVTGRKAVEQNRHFIYQFDGVSGDTWRKCIAQPGRSASRRRDRLPLLQDLANF